MTRKSARTSSLLAFLLVAFTLPAFPSAKVGAAAPGFAVMDMHGKTRNLSEFAGSYVVLEWLNYGCPFVGKHYGSGNMQSLQKQWTDKGVVWLSVISSAPGEQGHSNQEKAKADYAAKGSKATTVLLDAKGALGKSYGAATTPHMFVIDPKGNLIYNGGIDDKPTTDQSDVKTATNYVSMALRESMAGKAISVPSSQPYGCNVKY